MLTADLANSWQRGDKTGPRYIEARDADYLETAAALIEIFARHENRPRHQLAEALDAYVGLGVDYKILRGLIKLLTDRCTFETSSARDPVEIRRALFHQAGKQHPVLENDAARREAIVRHAALELECAPDALLAGLYADLPGNQLLTVFESLGAEALLDLYNVAQAQALLYRCVRMGLYVEPQATGAYRELFGAIKSYRLIHTVRGDAARGYEITLDGPVSMFHRSQKYGVQMAVFLPALLLCRGWRLRAEISAKMANGSTRKAYFELDSDQRTLRSHYRSLIPYDNPAIEKLAANWERLQSPWEMEPSREVIDLGDAAFVPDFVFRHSSGREVYLEVLGFWTPRHLQERLREFEHARSRNFLLAAWDELRGSREPLARVPPHAIIFKRNLDPAVVEAALDEILKGVEGR